MRVDIHPDLIPHINTLPDRSTVAGQSAEYPAEGTRVLILDVGRHQGQTGTIRPVCVPDATWYEVRRDEGYTNLVHASDVAVIDGPLESGDHMYTLDTLPNTPSTASVAGTIFEVDETHIPRQRHDPVVVTDGRRHNATFSGVGRSVLGHIRSMPVAMPTGDTRSYHQGRRCWVGTYVKIDPAAIAVLDRLRDGAADTDATGVPHEWEVGDRFTIEDIEAVRVGDQPVTGTVVHMVSPARALAIFDLDQDMQYPTIDQGSDVPFHTWEIRVSRATFIGRTSDLTVGVGDEVVTRHLTDATVTGFIRGTVVDTNEYSIRVRYDQAHGGTVTSDVFQRALGWWSDRSRVGTDSFVIRQGAPAHPTTDGPRVGDRVRITEHSNHRIVGRTGVLRAIDPGATEANRRYTIDYDRGQEFDGRRTCQRAAAIEVIPDPAVGDMVRVTSHDLAGYAGRTGRLEQVDRQRVAGNERWAILQESGRTIRGARGIEPITATFREWQVGDVVRVTTSGHAALGQECTIVEFYPGRAHPFILQDSRPGMGNWTEVPADGVVLVRGADGTATTGEAEAEDYQVGDLVRVLHTSDYGAMTAEGLVIRVGVSDGAGCLGIEVMASAGGTYRRITRAEMVHRRQRLPRLTQGEDWRREDQTIPVADIQVVARWAGQRNGEGAKADALAEGLPYGAMAYGRSVYDALDGRKVAEFRVASDAERWVQSRPTRETYTWREVQEITDRLGRGRLGWCSVATESMRYLEPHRQAAEPQRPRVQERRGEELPWFVLRADGSEAGRFATLTDADAYRLTLDPAPGAGENPF